MYQRNRSRISRRTILRRTAAAGAATAAAWIISPIGRAGAMAGAATGIPQEASMLSGGGSQAATEPGIPDTPAGRRLAQWLAAIAAGDIDTLRTFYAANVPDDVPPNLAEVRTAMDLLFRKQHGVPELHSIISSSDYEIEALLYTGLSELWQEVRLTIQAEPPHRLMGLGTRHASPPSEVARREPMTEAEIRGELDRYLAKLSAADVFSGAVLVAKDGRPLFAQAHGLADQGSGAPNRVETKFNLGSMNKMFTAVAIAQLAQGGRLSFGDPIGTYLPDYPQAVAGKVTVHHLLTHTSGLGDFFGPRYDAGKDHLRRPRDYFPLFIDKALEFEPGTDWRYSNAGFVVLGAIVAAVSGQDYFDFVRRHIYAPAGMMDTDSYERDAAVPNLALGYTHPLPEDPADLKAEVVLGPRTENTPGLGIKGSPAGGGYSTVEDLLRFDIALRANRLLSPAYTETVLAGKVDTPFRPGERYAYGFIDARVGGTRITGHGGGAPGINANLDMYLDLGYTAAVLSNYDGAAEIVSSKIRTLLTPG